ncbi:nitroreductase family protein [Candidatus Omnitrophota bacterium]
MEVIRNRRTIREYKPDPPKDTEIKKVLEAARWAPSGLNNQPWRFLVTKDKVKDGLAEFTRYGEIVKDAPVAIAVFMDNGDSYNRDKDLQAIGASIQNMCLEAHSLGLGTCWLGEILNKKEEVRRYLKAGADLELMAVVTLGLPDEDVTESSRKPLKSLVL